MNNVFGLISCVRKKNENQVRPFWILMQVLYSYLWKLTGTQRESEAAVKGVRGRVTAKH